MIDSRAMTRFELCSELAKYPDPPPPFGSIFSVEIPSAAGIYFLYNEGRIEYVGKATDLHKRIGGLSIFSHHAAEHKDEISWLLFERERVLEFVECFYIWLCRPGRNFGRKDESLRNRIKARNE